MAGSRLTSALGRLASHPSWTLAYWRGWRGVRSRGESVGGEAFSLSDRPEALRDERRAVTESTGADANAYDRALASAWFPSHVPGDMVAAWSREVLLRSLAVLTRLERPRIVVEVGVERGYSSAVILSALEAAGEGRLYSIDIPPLRGPGPQLIGEAVPMELRGRWELAIGPSRRILPDLVSRVGPIDLFLHDGDHSYESQREDLEVVWPRLRPGGLVVLDDVWTPALFDFADAQGTRPLVIERADSQDGVGLLRKGSSPVAPP